MNGHLTVLAIQAAVMNGDLRALTHSVEMIIAIFWYKFVPQSTNSIDMINISCFDIHINQNSIYGQFQHEFS